MSKKEGELQKAVTVKYSLTVQNKGKKQVKRNITFYNLDIIISVSYFKLFTFYFKLIS